MATSSQEAAVIDEEWESRHRSMFYKALDEDFPFMGRSPIQLFEMSPRVSVHYMALYPTILNILHKRIDPRIPAEYQTEIQEIFSLEMENGQPTDRVVAFDSRKLLIPMNSLYDVLLEVHGDEHINQKAMFEKLRDKYAMVGQGVARQFCAMCRQCLLKQIQRGMNMAASIFRSYEY